jgi:hypothetical protein
LVSRRRVGFAHRDRQFAARGQLVPGNFSTLQRDDVFVHIERDVIDHADWTEDEAQFPSELPPNPADALDQRRFLAAAHEFHET